MRHILEHNYEWARILDNALASFTERMALILFTPEQEVTEEIAFRSDVGVPDIAFRRRYHGSLPPRRDIYGTTDPVGHPVWLRNAPPPSATSGDGLLHGLLRACLSTESLLPT